MKHAQLSMFGMNAYHNSVPIKNEKELQVKEKRAKGQEEQIFSYFEMHQRMAFTPSQVWLVFGQCWPLTSVRARISNLTKAGMLRITGEKRTGYYGDPENCWQFVSPIKNKEGKFKVTN